MKTRKGIILAGGTGSRLHPLTLTVSKQLLPVYDKPMIFYPLSVLMLSGLSEILIISTPDQLPSFRALLGNGSALGIRIEYVAQPRPDGLAQAFILGREFLNGAPAALILGDNIFYGDNLQEMGQRSDGRRDAASIFAYHVAEPSQYGVVEFDADNKVISIEEKPTVPKSNFAATGLYFFPSDVPDVAAAVKPSPRGELEITSVIAHYLAQGRLHVETLGRGYAWLDTGTPESLLAAGQFIAMLEARQGLQVGCLEEISYRAGWIDAEQVAAAAARYRNSGYGTYLRSLIDG
ncbi:glucose-1-phosphate thymidylyltransferase RfbA [Sphingomonas psychrotolerans]|uniref:Glucose-1-phosphate thymidylyltransferase n=1 Tax=Sphingomonas psychrotolerans TaxID=1327635 RepID=A0A2K8MK82_9SPHN|nr:glucose-1-phosphate thymidylyltransferase RfbA [Sphingomonas psychrotolerans]ATY34288.1 glucose-1-phosphate thymidylyltransferase [Sphingomonas psychrotolerans]